MIWPQCGSIYCIFQLCTHCHLVKSIYFTANHPFFSPSTFPRIVNYSMKQGFDTKCPKYYNLSLLKDALKNLDWFILWSITLFPWISMLFSGILSITKVHSVLFQSYFFELQRDLIFIGIDVIPSEYISHLHCSFTSCWSTTYFLTLGSLTVDIDSKRQKLSTNSVYSLPGFNTGCYTFCH